MFGNGDSLCMFYKLSKCLLFFQKTKISVNIPQKQRCLHQVYTHSKCYVLQYLYQKMCTVFSVPSAQKRILNKVFHILIR